MYKLKSVGVLSVAKIMGAMYALLGLILMPFFLIAGMISSMAGGHDNPFGAIGGLALGIMAPIVYGGIGFVGGALSSLLYNLMAKWLGGIEVQIQAPTVTQASVV
jgi:hypothetical protein